MGKNVLILSGSPRKNGNSDILCNQFLKGAQESGNNAEKIFICDKNINYCIGCGACFGNPNYCSQKDDMGQILEKMIKANVIVMATPIYFYTMDGQMKTLIDRCCSAYTEMINKEFYFIMTMADDEKSRMDRTIEEFRGFTSCLKNPKEKGIIFGTNVWKVGEIQKSSAMNEAYQMGKSV